jgi:uncharacterized protein
VARRSLAPDLARGVLLLAIAVAHLFQSLVWLALFYPFTLDLRDTMGAAAALAVAVTIWLVSLVLAAWMSRTGQRGPAETLLRQRTYAA